MYISRHQSDGAMSVSRCVMAGKSIRGRERDNRYPCSEVASILLLLEYIIISRKEVASII